VPPQLLASVDEVTWNGCQNWPMNMNDAVRKLPVTIVPAEVRKPD
jgi:hypothetical protein